MKLVIYRGLPGCGKTTDARQEVRDRPHGAVARVNRDDIRRWVFHTRYGLEPPWFEDIVTVAQHGMIRALLKAGVDVLCDDTNLYPEHVALLMRLADECGADCRIRDMTHIPLDVCIQRDYFRAGQSDGFVGAKVIRLLFEKHSRNGWAPLPVPPVDLEVRDVVEGDLTGQPGGIGGADSVSAGDSVGLSVRVPGSPGVSGG